MAESRRSDTRVLRDRFLFFRSMAEAAKLEHEAPTDQDIEDLGVAAEEDDIESILRLVRCLLCHSFSSSAKSAQSQGSEYVGVLLTGIGSKSIG